MQPEFTNNRKRNNKKLKTILYNKIDDKQKAFLKMNLCR